MDMEFTQGRTGNRLAGTGSLYNLDQEEPPKNYSAIPSPSSTSAPANLPTTDAIFVEKEHMFDKVVTPSDVGKLNRLVIPKQHAEKYFPLDLTVHEKGHMLTFEDRSGKPWRFRYSYWNSSQSYVMTKGWSRFVKEKRLGAGDTVSFCRGVGEAGRGRYFIDWRRRPDPPLPQFHDSMLTHRQPAIPTWAGSARVLIPPYECGSSSRYQYQHPHYQHQHQHPHPHQQIYFYRPQVAMLMQTSTGVPMVLDSVPIGNAGQVSPAAPKRVRLFGVNLDCPGTSTSTAASPTGSHSMNRININTHEYLPMVHNEAQQMLQPPTPADTESSVSEKEDCSLDLDL